MKKGSQHTTAAREKLRKPKSTEHREKLRQAALRRFADPQARENMRLVALRREADPKVRQKQRLAKLGTPPSPDAIEKSRLARWGVPLKRETREKISRSLAEHFANPEARATRSGPRNPKWRGGKRRDKDGYILLWAPTHPQNRGGAVPEHRLVMEQRLGRFLTRQEVVHHKNEIKDDNRIENLLLLPTVRPTGGSTRR